MTKKVLFCATVDYHFKAFHLPYMKWFKEQGWEVHIAAAGNNELPYTDQKFTIPIQRSPFHYGNIKAFLELKKLIRLNEYDLVHCHTPLGGVLARLASVDEKKKNGLKIIYTAHGFHFCKGASVMNWLMYYPVEKLLAPLTDCLITINDEDYFLALAHHFKTSRIERVHGVGVDMDKYKPIDGAEEKLQLRQKLGYREEHFLLFNAAEFNKNKNQKLLIKALATVKDELPTARLLLAGEGSLVEECKRLAYTLGVEKQVDFLGFRKDIVELLRISDVALGSSFREGLPVNILEAMACRLPLIVSDNRGHRELVMNQVNGFLVAQQDEREFGQRLLELFKNENIRNEFGLNSFAHCQSFSLKNVYQELGAIYSSYLVGEYHESESKYYRAHL
ncbi:glycosyltransferase family 4 protein [Alkalihalobacillus trypoxylicola]|uniref:Glycosyl transferase n=1 Tax=Alkalihalobacillus trypoxylicola TaxID=519424 RepID=A0A162D132_9BACI|nr:glycosyltransferase family 4 protein [Alkalihalobacillus trypoxylicola]KYG27665.1 glycosyl transferase [Alkalihalobacillus trypoxylicola]